MSTHPFGAQRAPSPLPAAPAASLPPPRLKRLLVIDNEPASTRLVRLMLERHGGFEICEVNDPTLAVASALQFLPDLILLDIEMPRLDGGAVARELHARPLLQKTPIVFMTSLVTEDEAAHPMFSGGVRVLAKPVTVRKLIQCVGELLSATISDRTEPAPATPPFRAPSHPLPARLS